MQKQERSTLKVSAILAHSIYYVMTLIALLPTVTIIEAAPAIKINAKARFENNIPQISGTVEVTNWRPDNGLCLYLPYNDASYGKNWQINQHLKMIKQKSLPSARSYGHIDVQAIGAKQLRADIVQLQLTGEAHQGSRFQFISKLPPIDPDQKDILFNDFIPIPLKSCDLQKPLTQLRFQEIDFSGAVRHSDPWILIAPFANGGIQSATVSAGLLRDFYKTSKSINGINIDLYYRDQDFSNLEKTVTSAITSHLQWLGPPPFKQINIIESSQLQSFSMPGIIAINKPKQSFFASLQKEWLNWSHWALTTLLAYQWFIPQVYVTKPADFWFFQGLIDFFTDQALTLNPLRNDLFNVFDLGFSMLSMNYRDIQNLTAALLEKNAPFARLTNNEFDTFEPFVKQHPLLFIRQSMALRHILSITGVSGFKRVLGRLREEIRDRPFEPKIFMRVINDVPSPFSPLKRKQISSTLKQWWTSTGWPDYSIDNVKATYLTGGRYLVEAEVEAEGEFQFPVTVSVTDASNRIKKSIAKKKKLGKYQATFITNYKPKLVEVDPGKAIYDRNRFNNSNDDPSIEFFPGSANSIKDDSYTMVWLPYLMRRPGEEAAVGLQSMLFKYINGELIMRLESQFDGKIGYLIQKRDKFPKFALGIDTALAQSFEGYRETVIALKRSPLAIALPFVSSAIKVRERRIVGQSKTSHGTFALELIMQPGFQPRDFTYQVAAELEQAPKETSPSFQYQRTTFSAQMRIHFLRAYTLSLRGFAGNVKADTAIPSNILFKPQNLSEGRIRLEMSQTPLVRSLISFSSDLFMPFALPLPADAFVLSNQLKWRFFYDIGKSTKPETLLSGSGLGILMPFGGDFIGAGSLALTQFSLLAVLYSRIDDRISHKPAILFDISGEL